MSCPGQATRYGGKNVKIERAEVTTPDGYSFVVEGYSSIASEVIVEAQAKREAAERAATLEAIKTGAGLAGKIAGEAAARSVPGL